MKHSNFVDLRDYNYHKLKSSNSHSLRTENTMFRCTSIFIFQAFWKMKGAFENAFDQINAHSIT